MRPIIFGGREAKAKEIAGQAVCTAFEKRTRGTEHLLLSRPALYDAQERSQTTAATAYLPLLGSRLPLTSHLNISKESANSVGSAGVLGRENQAGVERQEFSSFFRRVVITHLAARRNPLPPPLLPR